MSKYKSLLVGCLATTLLATTDLSRSLADEVPGAYFSFSQTDPQGVKRHFVFELSDPTRIAEARSILADPKSIKNHVQGVIVSSRTSYNPDWSFHLKPETVGFFEMQVEVCDANVTYVEKHLDEVGGSTLPRSFWCPWSSQLDEEVTARIDPATQKPK